MFYMNISYLVLSDVCTLAVIPQTAFPLNLPLSY